MKKLYELYDRESLMNKLFDILKSRINSNDYLEILQFDEEEIHLFINEEFYIRDKFYIRDIMILLERFNLEILELNEDKSDIENKIYHSLFSIDMNFYEDKSSDRFFNIIIRFLNDILSDYNIEI